jgi:transposase
MSRFYVGLDVHSKMTEYVVEDAEGTVIGEGRVQTTPEGLRSFVVEHAVEPGTRVGLETGTMTRYVVALLQDLGLEPVVIDAHEVRLKAYRPRQKSDRRDAFEICEGLRRNIYRTIVHMPPEPIQRLRATLAQRRHFVRVQSAEMSATKHVLRSSGLRRLSRHLKAESGWQRLTSQIEDALLGSRIALHHAVWRVAGEQVALLDKSLVEQSRHFEADFLRLQTVPGVGPIVALTAISAFSDAKRFPSAKHAASYAGLVPSTSQSGDRDWHGHITKQGSAELRSMLCEAAHHASHKNHPLNPYFKSLCARRGYKMAITAIAHRLCRVLYAMLRDHKEFDLHQVGVEVGPFEKKIVMPYRLRRSRVLQP